MTLNEISQYRLICHKIKGIQSLLDSNYVGDTVQSASSHPYALHSVHIEGYKTNANTLTLLVELSSLNQRKTDIEEFVHNIVNYDIQLILAYKYLRGNRKPSWQSIATKLGFCSEHTPKRKIIKFFTHGGNGGK